MAGTKKCSSSRYRSCCHADAISTARAEGEDSHGSWENSMASSARVTKQVGSGRQLQQQHIKSKWSRRWCPGSKIDLNQGHCRSRPKYQTGHGDWADSRSSLLGGADGERKRSMRVVERSCDR
ncbi:unnamed protein product [Ectocarpus sp. 12 AP-2014]